MIVGFNHNINYRGKTFHVQTEDSGPQRPQLVTLLYHGGTIISSRKTLYADIVKVDHLEKVVEDLAKEQHKDMLRSLTRGELDQRIEELGIILESALVQQDQDKGQVKQENQSEDKDDNKVAITAEPVIDKFRKSKAEAEEPSLSDVIYAYLTAGR